MVLKRKKLKGEDDIPEFPPAITQDGDLYELGEHRIMCGNSTDPIDITTLFPEGIYKADIIFTDPPYNVNYKGQGKNTSTTIANDNLSIIDFKEFLGNIFVKYENLLKDNGVMYCCYASSTHREFEDGVNQAGFTVRNQIIWVKTVGSFGWGDYKWKHEPILYCVKNDGKPEFYGDKSQYTVWDEEKTDEELLEIMKKMIAKEEAGQSTVWRLSRDQNYQHPTQKPVALITKALENSSKRGARVCDLFMGSGSTLIGAECTGRIAIGMELSPRYVDGIVQRYVDFCNLNGKTPIVKRNGKICHDFK